MLQSTKTTMDGLYMQLEHLRTQSSQKDGGSWEHDGRHRMGAARTSLVCERQC
jgi:hypothetical protein